MTINTVKPTGIALVAGLALAACAGEEIPTETGRSLAAGARGGFQAYEAALLPLNRAYGYGVAAGRVRIEVDGDRVAIVVEARGLQPGDRHAVDLRGFPAGARGACPSAAADRDGDGLVRASETTPEAGPVLLSLDGVADGRTDAGSPRAAGPDGVIVWERIGSLTEMAAAVEAGYGPAATLLPLDGRQVVIHGASRDARLPDGVSAAVVPVACGELRRVR
ncbi:MAG TPA: hypothetical protein VM778_02165 [Gemmatimonadota bacterium]|nr:hypothetical protein [Gemmatimonadota bacterium]